MIYFGKRKTVVLLCMCAILALSLVTIFGRGIVSAAGTIHYVDGSASGTNSGANWTNAFLLLQDALDLAVAGDEIWVADGVYKPTKQTDAGDARTANFELIEGVTIYGGFAGGEANLTDRDWETNQTILSGDLDDNDTDVVTNNGITLKHTFIRDNNAYNIVVGNSAITYTNGTVLDGFVLTGGFTKNGGAEFAERDGGAIRFEDNASPILRNLWIVGNKSRDDGGAIHFHDHNDPIFENVIVESADASDFTGGIYFESDNNPTFLNVTVKDTGGRYSSGIYLHLRNTATFANLTMCRNVSRNLNANSGSDGGGNAGTALSFASENTIVVMNGVFAANTAGERGGGIRMKRDNDVTLHNISVSGNQATEGGGIYIRNTGNSVTMTNSIIWGNSDEIVADAPVNLNVSTSIVGNSASPYTGTGNIASVTTPFVQNPDDGADNSWGTSDDNCGDLSLLVSAAAVNAGSNSSLPNDLLDVDNDSNTAEVLPLDIEGQFRIFDTTVDLGAYEISVSPTPQTITFNLSPAAQAGLSVMDQEPLTGTATSGLPVAFSTTTPSVCSISGLVATMLDVGSCTIIGSQAGDGTYGAAPNVSRTIVVTKIDQTVSISSPAAAASFTIDDVVTLAGSASSGLTVTFGTSTPAVCSVSGTSATMLQAGSCTLLANQAGDAEYNPAPQASRLITVEKKAQTINFIDPAASASFVTGNSVNLVATASSGLTVDFASSTPTICSVSGNVASMLMVGTCELVASQAGNGEFGSADSVIRQIAVGSPGLQTQSITFSSPADQSGESKNQIVNLTASASSGLPVSFSTTTSSVCTISGSVAILNNFGACEIVASQSGNSSYNPATNVIHTVYVKRTQSINFPTPPSVSNAQMGGTVILAADASSTLPVSFASTTPLICTVSGNVAQLVAGGICKIEANQQGDNGWFAAGSASITFNVEGTAPDLRLIFLPLVVR